MKMTHLLPVAFLAIATIGVTAPTPGTANSAGCSVFQSRKSCERHDRADRKAAAKSSTAKADKAVEAPRDESAAKTEKAAEKASKRAETVSATADKVAKKAKTAAKKANNLEKRATKAAAAAEAES